ncbi:hypothetical protein [Pedobacter nutrimenti]|uniref:hypothetical protein n=1 Tax=Pedobacter nutrimenti TaxID=1241337 RepID=UPI00292CEA96|nr:hypothetical protein [Pedobacter nutrimenti]
MMSKKLIDNLIRASSWFSVGLGVFAFSAVLIRGLYQQLLIINFKVGMNFG